MEREKAGEHFTGAVGDLRDGVRLGFIVQGVCRDAVSARRSGERGLSGHAGAFGELVSAFGTGARQRVLEPLPTFGGGGVCPTDGLANSRLWLANHADARRRPSISLAADMVVLHQRPSPKGEMDFAGGEGVFGRRAAAGSIRPGAGQKSAVVAVLSATRG